MSTVTALRVTYPSTGEVVGEVPISGPAEVVATLDLVGADGGLVARWPTTTRPEDSRIAAAIEAALPG
jgi:hypothetical protein